MKKVKYLINLCVYASLMIFSVGVIAQTTTSTIEGTVTDSNGAAIAGAQVKVTGDTVGTERTVVADGQGVYRIVALPAGNYTLEFSHTGFATRTSKIELTLNRTAVYNVALKVGDITNVVDVTSEVPLVDESISSTGSTVTPEQIQELPVNGRDYLDLLQLVPGTAINRQSTGDNANPILGERSGNNNFLIDGHSNKDTVNGGPAAQFNQETIAEFQVLTTGFKAEFGQASGAVVNVITKSGTNEYHGVASLFHRNEAFDSSNSLTAGQDAPHLRRFDYSFAFGGPLINPGFGEGTEFFKPLKDKVFFFGSVERITENRTLDFEYPNLGTTAAAQTILGLLRNQEDQFNLPNATRETRAFFKLNEQLGRHSLSQEINYTNGVVKDFLPFGSSSLPSSRNTLGSRNLLLAFGDTVLLGDQSNPFILTLRAGYRDEPSSTEPSHPEGGPSTLSSFFTAVNSNINNSPFFSNLPQTQFGNANTFSETLQKYTTFSVSGNKLFGDHDIKFGWNFMKTRVTGTVPRVQTNQTFNTIDDFLTYGPVNAGIFLLLDQGGVTPEDSQINLKNDYNALWVQDDWKISNRLTLNLGVRWDYDSEFKAKNNFSPRLGAAWAINDKTVVRGNFGIFYDQFRLGLVRLVPEFGGADLRQGQSLYFPRGFYGSPSLVSSLALAVGLPGGCFSNSLTDAQIIATGALCPLAPSLPYIGVDRLNRVVAQGNAPIPANAVINISNIQALSGLTPEQYLIQAAAAIGQAPGYFQWGAFGVLANPILPPAPTPTSVDGTFETPNTMGFSVGFKRELTRDLAIEADYHHKDIRNILGVRKSNLSYATRVAGVGLRAIDPAISNQLRTFGPFFEGKYDALVVAVNKRLSNRYLFGASYTYAKATDNVVSINGLPSDSFVGTVPVVVEPGTGATNANGSFTSTNGNFVAQAGTFSNGPDLDKGDSGLALDHIFQANGLVNLPWQVQLSGIFRVQSGFRFSRSPIAVADPDGDGFFVGRDILAGKNAFQAPAFVNVDMRVSKTFNLGERLKAQFLFEFFNLLNRQNPGSVSTQHPDLNPVTPFGTTTQVLPGREGQIGFRLEF
ncbi:MAG: TonB-dependent receptor [Pyrinomonadaceae bacterium]